MGGWVQVSECMSECVGGWMVTSFPGRNNTSGRTRVMLLPVSMVTRHCLPATSPLTVRLVEGPDRLESKLQGGVDE